ncbi:MAG: hypothetical protein ACLUNZ_11405 [Evtepia sp.]
MLYAAWFPVSCLMQSALLMKVTGMVCWNIPSTSRPEVWHDRHVPPILLSGHHANIAKWRRKQALRRTKERRPDMYENRSFL